MTWLEQEEEEAPMFQSLQEFTKSQQVVPVALLEPSFYVGVFQTDLQAEGERWWELPEGWQEVEAEALLAISFVQQFPWWTSISVHSAQQWIHKCALFDHGFYYKEAARLRAVKYSCTGHLHTCRSHHGKCNTRSSHLALCDYIHVFPIIHMKVSVQTSVTALPKCNEIHGNFYFRQQVMQHVCLNREIGYICFIASRFNMQQTPAVPSHLYTHC